MTQAPAILPSALLKSLCFEHPAKNEKARILESDGSTVVETTNAKGKSRQKTVKGYDAPQKALMELLRKGFFVCDNGTLVLHTEVGPPLGHCFCIDELRDVAWLGDWNALRRVCLKTGQIQSFDTQPFCGIRKMAVDSEGKVWLLAQTGPVDPSSAWLEPTDSQEFGVLTADVAGSPELWHSYIVERPFFKTTGAFLGLCEGGVLVPRPGGAALLDRHSKEVKISLETGQMKHWSPQAAIDPSGRHLAVTKSPNCLEILDHLSGTREKLAGEFDDVLHLEVDCNGRVQASTATPHWDFQILQAGEMTMTLGNRSGSYFCRGNHLYNATNSRGKILEVSGSECAEFEVLGGIKASPLFVTESFLYARTSLGVFQRQPNFFLAERMP